MKKLFIATLLTFASHNLLHAHCQLPCGIYHDEMVYDEIDQYVETMYKGISVMNDNHFETPENKNQFIRWVMQKEEASNSVATRLTEYFLQQKVKPGTDEDTANKLSSIHRLLFLLVQIKQHSDLDFVKSFNEEWIKFKLMLHSADYECEMIKRRMLKYEQYEKEFTPELQKTPDTKTKKTIETNAKIPMKSEEKATKKTKTAKEGYS